MMARWTWYTSTERNSLLQKSNNSDKSPSSIWGFLFPLAKFAHRLHTRLRSLAKGFGQWKPQAGISLIAQLKNRCLSPTSVRNNMKEYPEKTFGLLTDYTDFHR